MSRKSRIRFGKTILYWIILAPLAVINIFPFAVMLATALKPGEEIFANPPGWLASRFAWNNVIDMWREARFGGALWNSLQISVLSVLLTILVGIPAAYAVFRFRFKGRDIYRRFLLITQMVSPIVLVLGLFRLFVQFGWVDTHMPLIVTYAAFNLAFTVLMLESYFATIPLELEEAAWVDGATRRQTIVRIFLPLALPAVLITGTFTFVNVWNEFVIALTLLRSAENYTLPLNVFGLASNLYVIAWHHVMAAVLLATLPVTIVFIWLQKYLIRGMSTGAIK
jgi:multiple sugar transport system permease protein